ncbi:MAG: molybdopterin-dependent oxidoreductase [Desulfobacterales bacterium]|nr:molybdopterin-dependent oxidoreductase [Desulfobacterales bacterium]
MKTRRQALKLLIRLFFWIGTIIGLGLFNSSRLWAKVKKRILPKNTDLSLLRNKNPKYLDTRNLEIMPLETFQTMGDKDAPFEAKSWRLRVTGAVRTNLALTYAEILSLPSTEKEVLLVCPGVFVNHGRWKGIAIKKLLERAKPSQNVSKVHIYGLNLGSGDRKETFSIDDVSNGQVFLSYAVNGQTLPRKQGFPLRVVAEGHWGSTWVKYVYKIEFK